MYYLYFLAFPLGIIANLIIRKLEKRKGENAVVEGFRINSIIDLIYVASAVVVVCVIVAIILWG